MFRFFSDYVKLFTGTCSDSDTPHEVATAVPSAVLGHSGTKSSLSGCVSENITQCAYSGVSPLSLSLQRFIERLSSYRRYSRFRIYRPNYW